MARKNIYVIADLHMNANNPEIANIFEKFLNDITSIKNILFIIGDFFDYWIGDNHKDEFYHKITSQLKRANDKNLKILFMHGNRDFLIGRRFEKESGAKIVKDPYYLNIRDKRILFSHGDLFCTDDRSYHFYRKWIAYNRPLRFFFERLPLFIREKTANNLRKVSFAKNRKDSAIDITLKGVEKYRKDCNVIIHGHTHKMNIQYERTHTRYVLGDWFKIGNYIIIRPNGEISQVKEYSGLYKTSNLNYTN